MSILIKGIKMPTEGMVITIYKLNGKFYASVHGTELCPLIEVPTPHGDLVDRSEMREIAISLLDKAVTDQEANAIREMWSHLGQMPVFISSEGEET